MHQGAAAPCTLHWDFMLAISHTHTSQLGGCPSVRSMVLLWCNPLLHMDCHVLNVGRRCN